MTPRADQSYLRAMADLPDGWQLLEAYVAGIKAERDQAEAIARAVIAKVGPLEQRAADLVAQLNHEVEVRRSQKREMQAEIDAARTEAAQAKAALTDWPDAPLPVETSATEAKPRKTVKLDLRNAPSAAEGYSEVRPVSAPSPLDPTNWRPLDDAARDGKSVLVRDADSFAMAKWDGERFVYPLSGRPIDIEPTAYLVGGHRG